MKKIILLILMLAGAVGISQTPSLRENRIDNPMVYNQNKNENSGAFVGAINANFNETSASTGFVNTQKPRTLADTPGVVNNPDRTAASFKSFKTSPINERPLNTNTFCQEENPNDFTFENGYYVSASSPYKTANDLTVAAGENFTLTNITASIFANGGITNVKVNYYSSVSGLPGTLIGSEASATIDSQTVIGSNFGFDVREVEMTVSPFLFAGQSNISTKYWIELSVTDTGGTRNVHWVVTSSSSVGSPSAQYDNGWFIPNATMDGVYIWKGDCETIGGGNTCETPIVEVNQDVDTGCVADVSIEEVVQSYLPLEPNAAGVGVKFTTPSSGLNVELSLWDGLPGTGGNLLASGTTLTDGSNWVDVYWNTTVSVTVGNTYYIVVDGDSTLPCLSGSQSNSYTDGQLFLDNSPTLNSDLTFRTYSCDDSGGNCAEENPNDFTFENGYVCASNSVYKAANDLTVAAGENFTLTNITASVFANGGIANVDVNYYADSSGLPGLLIGSEASVTIDNQTVIGNNFELDVNELELSVTPFLFAGEVGSSKKYWIELSITDAANSNDVYWVLTSSTSVGSPAALYDNTWRIDDPIYDGVYVWEGNCESIVTEPFPSPYCGPLNFIRTIEPITLVEVAGINNRSDAAIGGSPAHEDFTAVEGVMELGANYLVALEGNTNGVFENRFVIFIDWNQNGALDDAGEVYEIAETISGSTGTDGQQAAGLITVPADAMLGSTRMRVKKIFRTSNYLNPCLGAHSGQAEDYTIQVLASNTNFVYQNNTWTPTNPAGVSTSIDNIHIVNGSVSFTTNITANNVNIDSGATLQVEKVLTVAGDINNNGDLIFVSSATSNGELGMLTGSSIINGTATVQRYMKNKRSYRMVSSAVTTTTSIHENWQEGAVSNTDNPAPGFGTHITGSTVDQQNGFDGTSTGNSSMFKVNVATQQFEAVSNTNVNTLTAGEGYLLFVRGDRTIDLNDNNASSETILRATGSLVTGPYIHSFPEAESGDFVMFGNPYQSAVNINSVFTGSTNVNANQYYIYDPSLGEFGSYVTVLLPSGINTSGSSANQYLQPGQGAQAAITGNAPEVIFNETNKAPGNFTSTNRNAITSSNMLTVQLFTTENFNNGEALHDSFGILFEEGYNNALTASDALKPMNFYENLGINHNGTLLSFEQREMPQASDEFSLYIAGYQKSNYTLKITIDGLEGTLFYLDDNFTGTTTLLESGDNVYSFLVDKADELSIATDRFKIRTQHRLDVADSNLLSGVRLYPNPLKGNVLFINAPGLNGEQLSVRITDLTGRTFFEEILECNNDTIFISMANGLSSGVYLVNLRHRDKQSTFRLIKN